MNNLKTNPVGVDVLIKELQIHLYENLGFSNIDGYGRIYLKENEGKTTPEHFVPGKEFIVTRIHDKLNGLFFFVKEEKEKRKYDTLTADVEIVFLLDLKKLKPSVPHLADEEVKIQIIDTLKSFDEYEWTEIISEKDALKGIDLKLTSLNPYHFIKFTGTLKYYINCK